MSGLDMTIRRATRHDARALSPLINQAGEGLPALIWGQLAEPGQDPWEVGVARVESDDAGISHRNAWVAQVHGTLAGCLLAYRQPDTAEPIPEDVPAMFRPLLELEAQALSTGYVYVLSTVPEMQGQGVGNRLLEFAERYRGPAGMSLIVSNANTGARRLYERHGYLERATRPMVKDGWDNPGTEWVLMVKPA